MSLLIAIDCEIFNFEFTKEKNLILNYKIWNNIDNILYFVPFYFFYPKLFEKNLYLIIQWQLLKSKILYLKRSEKYCKMLTFKNFIAKS